MAYFKTILATLTTLLIIETTAVEYYAYKAAEPHSHYYDPIAKYSFQYAVKDDHTGDVKSQKETREGDVVKGYYTLLQPDGKKRIVEYSADKKSGFVANVRYEGGYDHIYAPNHKSPAAKYQPLAVKYLGNKLEEQPQKDDEFNQEVSKYESPKFDAFKYGSIKLELPEFKESEAFKYGSAKLELPEFKDLKIIPATYDFSNFETPKFANVETLKYEAPKIDFSQYMKAAAKLEAPKTAQLKANTPSFSEVFSSALLETPYFNYKL